MDTLIAAPGLDQTSQAFRQRLIAIANELGLSADALAVVMAFETGGTFSPSQKNLAGSGAVGLIQFMPSTANYLGTTTAELAAMSAVEQLDYVEKYFAAVGPSLIKTPLDHYLAVFSPGFVGKKPDTPMYSKGSKAYEQNAGLDADGDGTITVGDVGQKFGSLYLSSNNKPRIPVLEGSSSGNAVAVIGMAVTIISLASLRRQARRVS